MLRSVRLRVGPAAWRPVSMCACAFRRVFSSSPAAAPSAPSEPLTSDIGRRPRNRPLNVLLFGSSDVAVPTLHALHHNMTATASSAPTAASSSASRLSERVVGRLEVVVPPPRTKNYTATKSDLHAAADALGVRTHAIPAEVNFRMEGYSRPEGDFDIGVVVSFGYFIPARIIHSFPMHMINAHASLLPRLRGAAPIQRALMQGETSTGVSIITLHPTAIDHGRLLLQRPLPLAPTATFQSAAADVGAAAATAVLETLARWDEVLPASREQAALIAEAAARDGAPLPPALAVAPKIQKADQVLRWHDEPAQAAYNRWRGLFGFLPVHTKFRGKRVNITAMDPPLRGDGEQGDGQGDGQKDGQKDGQNDGALAHLRSLPAGSVVFDPSLATPALLVVCAGGSVARVTRLQVECRKETDAAAFAHGHAIPHLATLLHAPTASAAQSAVPRFDPVSA